MLTAHSSFVVLFRRKESSSLPGRPASAASSLTGIRSGNRSATTGLARRQAAEQLVGFGPRGLQGRQGPAPFGSETFERLPGGGPSSHFANGAYRKEEPGDELYTDMLRGGPPMGSIPPEAFMRHGEHPDMRPHSAFTLSPEEEAMMMMEYRA